MEIFATLATKLGWGDPGAPKSAQGKTYERQNIVTMRVPGVPALRVHKGAVPLFSGFLRDLLATGYVIDRGQLDDWGFAHRWKNLSGEPWVGHLSEHSNGTAVDVNALANPQGRPLRTNLNPATARRLAAKWGLRWGGDYTGTPDPMHFEVVVGPGDVAAIVARNSAATSPTQPGAPTPAAKPAGSGAQAAVAAPKAASPGKSTSSAFSGPFGAVWRLLVEGALVLGGIAAVVLGANRAAGGAPGRAVKTAVKIGAMA